MKKQFLIAIMAFMAISLSSCYDFNREQNEKDAESNGRAILLEAESSKKAKIEEAKAEKESADLIGQAKITQAKAEAEAMLIKADAKAKAIRIETDAMGSIENYLHFKTIEAMYQNGKFIYIPTEAGMPILEGGKR
jgi:regulator of protease activity HflC (stomatin/prohibitin superfamily)